MQFGKANPPTTEARSLAPGTCREEAISQGARRVHDGVAAYGGVALLGARAHGSGAYGNNGAVA
jgi:hypothetical protein